MKWSDLFDAQEALREQAKELGAIKDNLYIKKEEIDASEKELKRLFVQGDIEEYREKYWNDHQNLINEYNTTLEKAKGMRSNFIGGLEKLQRMTSEMEALEGEAEKYEGWADSQEEEANSIKSSALAPIEMFPSNDIFSGEKTTLSSSDGGTAGSETDSSFPPGFPGQPTGTEKIRGSFTPEEEQKISEKKEKAREYREKAQALRRMYSLYVNVIGSGILIGPEGITAGLNSTDSLLESETNYLDSLNTDPFAALTTLEEVEDCYQKLVNDPSISGNADRMQEIDRQYAMYKAFHRGEDLTERIRHEHYIDNSSYEYTLNNTSRNKIAMALWAYRLDQVKEMQTAAREALREPMQTAEAALKNCRDRAADNCGGSTEVFGELLAEYVKAAGLTMGPSDVRLVVTDQFGNPWEEVENPEKIGYDETDGSGMGLENLPLHMRGRPPAFLGWLTPEQEPQDRRMFGPTQDLEKADLRNFDPEFVGPRNFEIANLLANPTPETMAAFAKRYPGTSAADWAKIFDKLEVWWKRKGEEIPNPLDDDSYDVPWYVWALQEYGDKEEDYLKKFGRGNVVGGILNSLGTALNLTQSLYLNICNAILDLCYGEMPTFHYRMNLKEYYDEGKQYGQWSPFDALEELKNQGPVGKSFGGFLEMLLEMVSDPLVVYSIAKSILQGSVNTLGTSAYKDALMRGDFARSAQKTWGKYAAENVDEVAGSKTAELGQKLDYPLGKATGKAHNVQRSQSMANELKRIGIHDTPMDRATLEIHLNEVLSNPSNIIKTEVRSYTIPGQVPVEYTATIRESFFMGPGGGVKFETIWDGNRLLTIIVKGGR